MRAPNPLPTEAMEELAALLQQCRTSAEYRRVECVWLRAPLGLSATQIATVLGWHVSSVYDLHSRYLRAGIAALQGPGRGGRHRQNLSLAEEQALLTQFNGAAAQGGLWEARAVRDTYRKLVGHPVPKSAVYRLLARHGWRKLAPRPRHPKADPARQKAFKKNSDVWWPESAHGRPHRACVCVSGFRTKRVLG
jgi:transposase